MDVKSPGQAAQYHIIDAMEYPLEIHPPSLPNPKQAENLSRFANAVYARSVHGQGGSRDDLDVAVSLYRQALKLGHPPHPARFSSLTNLANIMMIKHSQGGSRGNLDEAITLYREALVLRPLPNPERYGSLINLANGLTTRFEHGGQPGDLYEAMPLYREALEFPYPHPGRSNSLVNLANILFIAFSKLGAPRDNLNEAISLYREALELRLPTHPGRYGSLRSLANALTLRFEHEGQQGDVDEAISLYREALELQPPLRSDQSGSLNDLAHALRTRFKKGGRRGDLDEAISLYRRALNGVRVTHPNQSSDFPISDLANALFARFREEGQQHDLDEAITCYRRALEVQPLPHNKRSGSLGNLGNALNARFEKIGQRCDLDEAILLYRQALKLQDEVPLNPVRSDYLNNLAIALTTQFEKGGQIGDLGEAIALHRQALELRQPPHPAQSSSLDNLADALKLRFDQGGHQRDDLDEAILVYRQAFKLQKNPHPERSGSLNNLAAALSTKFRHGGQRSDLDQAISLYGEALNLRPPPHPGRSSVLSNLGEALNTRFGQGGQRDDLDEAISMFRQTLELRLTSHLDQSNSGFLNNFGNALLARFKQGGKRGDLHEAISLYTQVLELYPPSHLGRSICLTNLANALTTRFLQELQQRDLSEAILLHRQAVELQHPPHCEQSTFLANLAQALHIQYSHMGQKSDLNEVIQLNRKVLELRPQPHLGRPLALRNLALTLTSQPFQRDQQGSDAPFLLPRQTPRFLLHSGSPTFFNDLEIAEFLRFGQGGHPDDIFEAIKLCEHALELELPPHPGRSLSLHILGGLYLRAHSLAGDMHYLEEAMSSFCSSVQCSHSPSLRFRIARHWSSFADFYQHSSAIEAYEAAIQALSQSASLSLDVESRQEVLSIVRGDGLARKAAHCAIRGGHLTKAVEFLEAGRAVLWSQVLQVRAPLDKLQDIAPELGNRLRNIAISLKHGSRQNVDALDNRAKMTLELETSQFRHFTEEWDRALDEVRQIEGFETFLKPLSLSSVQRAATEYPVAFLVPDMNHSDCLLMTTSDIHHIPLSNNVSDTDLRILVDLGKFAVSQMGRSLDDGLTEDSLPPASNKTEPLIGERLKGKRQNGQSQTTPSSDDVFKRVLKILWDEVAKPVIEHLGVQKSEDQPVRLQWCPTGLFTFLPIHAAGIYNHEGEMECASDYVISSYTPTAGALLTPDAPEPGENFEILAVSDAGLYYAQKEIEKIATWVPKDCLTQLGTPRSPALVEGVFSRLPAASIAHFACHGVQDRSIPLNSALLLKDGELRISKIMQQSYPNGSLAFLCACETAMGDEKLPDEAMSLGASMIFSGFRNVVATMWKMADADGPTVADAFYEELFRGPDGAPGPRPDFGRSAQALHIAVKKLRSTGVGFRRWVPFVHMGK